jgi:hypothetical protein
MEKLKEYRFWVVAGVLLIGGLLSGVSTILGGQQWDAFILNLGTELIGGVIAYFGIVSKLTNRTLTI